MARTTNSLSCLNEKGLPVPWYAILKAHGGLDYSYVDASYTGTGPLQLTGLSLDCGTNCALGATLTQIIGNTSVARISWNDELPLPVAEVVNTNAKTITTSTLPQVGSGESGHTKGVIGADANGGFWMTHSMPKFPTLVGVDSYNWLTSTTYGQSFLCVSVDADTIEVVAKNIAFIDPHIYASVVPAGLTSVYPALTALVAGARAAGTSTTTILATDSTPFEFFGKSGSWGKDIWEDLVQATLGVDMFVETWRRSPQMLTYCRPDYPYDSINVATLQFIDATGAPFLYKYTQDHTKMAIAINATAQQNYFCIGDMNRMTSQWIRGGSATCFRHSAIFESVSAMILTVDGCAAP